MDDIIARLEEILKELKDLNNNNKPTEQEVTEWCNKHSDYFYLQTGAWWPSPKCTDKSCKHCKGRPKRLTPKYCKACDTREYGCSCPMEKPK